MRAALATPVFKIPTFAWMLAIIFWVVMLMLVLGGCSLLQTQVGPTAKKVTDYYCTQPLEMRLAARAEIAKAIAPATLTLVCPGDNVTPVAYITPPSYPALDAVHDQDRDSESIRKWGRNRSADAYLVVTQSARVSDSLRRAALPNRANSAGDEQRSADRF